MSKVPTESVYFGVYCKCKTRSSVGVYKHTVKYALSAGILDTVLQLYPLKGPR